MTKHWSSKTGANSKAGAPPDRISDNSPLFSSSALRAKAEAVSRATTSRTRDDSGIIDLKALIAQGEQEKTAGAASALHVTPHLPVYPFGTPIEASAPTPITDVQPATFTGEESSTKPWKRSRRGRAGGVAIGAALLSIAAVAAAAVSVGLNAFEVPRAAMASPTITAIQWGMTPAMAAPEAEEPEVASAQPSSTEEEQAAPALSTPRPPKQIPHIAQAPTLNKTNQTPAVPKTPPQATTPKNDPCKGDLMCAMQRAVKK